MPRLFFRTPVFSNRVPRIIGFLDGFCPPLFLIHLLRTKIETTRLAGSRRRILPAKNKTLGKQVCKSPVSGEKRLYRENQVSKGRLS
jgi:hypothetical protein